MPKSDLDNNFSRIEDFVKEAELFVPISNIANISFRGDLAGLLVVLISATYENCVKETVINYAANYGREFGQYTQNSFERINSRISIDDLYRYAKQFDVAIHEKFRCGMISKKDRVRRYTGQDIQMCYKNLLQWRHDFAHTANRNTTLREAFQTHRLAKHVLYEFDGAFNEH